MKKIYLLLMLWLITLPSMSQTTIALEDFDGTSTWTNNVSTSLFVDPSSPNEGLFIQEGSNLGPDNVVFGRDLTNESGEEQFNPITLTFDPVDISAVTNVEVSFEYDLNGFDNTDEISYTLFVDNSAIDSGIFSGDDAGTYSFQVADAANSVNLEVVLDQNGAADSFELDNFQIISNNVPPACSIADVSASAQCIGENASITISFTASNASEVYEVSIDGDTFQPITNGGTVTISGPTSAQAAASVEVRDVNEITCVGVTTVDLPECPSNTTPIRINEFHYDNDGTDVGEFVEIFVGDLAGLPNPENYTVYLVNGNGGSFYNSETLNNLTVSSDQFGTYYVWVVSGIQNGAPDGIALCGPNGAIEFISYEGLINGTGGCIDGISSTDVGVEEDGASPSGSSLQFFPSTQDPVLLTTSVGTWEELAQTPGVSNSTILPITLSSFTAQLQGKNAMLEWTTLSEENNELIEIQRSFDGLEWETVGTVNGQGTTDQTHSYRFIDYNIVNGTTYYQLKQIDFDGTSSFSDIVSITTDDVEGLSIGAVSRESINLVSSLEGQASFNVFNSMGVLVATAEFEAIKGGQTIYYQSGEIAAGFYIVQVDIEGQILTKKFIVR